MNAVFQTAVDAGSKRGEVGVAGYRQIESGKKLAGEGVFVIAENIVMAEGIPVSLSFEDPAPVSGGSLPEDSDIVVATPQRRAQDHRVF